MSPGIAATQSIVLPILGEDASDWKDGLAHAATWATKITHARKAYPELDQKLTPFIHQCTAPGALKVLNSLLAGKGKEQVAEEYEASELAILDPPVLNAENVQQLATFHNDWLELILQGCAASEQLILVRKIQEIDFPTPDGDAYTFKETSPFIARLYKLFQDIPADRRDETEDCKEIREAVYRQIPVPIRNLLRNQRAGDGADDTWVTICEALAKNAHEAERAAPVVEAFSYRPERSLKRRRIANEQDQKFTAITAVNVLNPSKDARHLEQDDEQITCEDCKTKFKFTKGEQEFYQSKGLTKPKRCKACRTMAAAKIRAAAKIPSDRLANAMDREKAQTPGK